jgi:hypothetical protein
VFRQLVNLGYDGPPPAVRRPVDRSVPPHRRAPPSAPYSIAPDRGWGAVSQDRFAGRGFVPGHRRSAPAQPAATGRCSRTTIRSSNRSQVTAARRRPGEPPPGGAAGRRSAARTGPRSPLPGGDPAARLCR